MISPADEGTIAHQLAAMCLNEGTDAAAYVGRLLEAEDYEHAKLSPSNAARWMACPGSHVLETQEDFVERSFSFEVTDDMAEHVQVYVDAVRERVQRRELEGAEDVTLLVEQQLPIGHLTGEGRATGTGDALIISTWPDGTATIDVIDLKFGRGVAVEVEGNEQLQMYALGAVFDLELCCPITKVCLVIHQPRLQREPKEWEVSIEELSAFGDVVRQAAERVRQVTTAASMMGDHFESVELQYLNAGEKQCRFCKAKAMCPALAARVYQETDFDGVVPSDTLPEQIVKQTMRCSSSAEYTDEVDLALKMQAVGVVELWCKAVRAEVAKQLMSGKAIPGYKLVQGKRGVRAWSDATEAEALLKTLAVPEQDLYSREIISPTTAQKLLKATPEKWEALTPLITQSEGKPSVVLATDKRPALKVIPVESYFDVLGEDDVDP